MKKKENIDEKKNAEAVEEACQKAGKKAGQKTDTGKIKIKARFATTYIGTLGNFYSGKEYDLTPEQFDLFSGEVKVI